VLAAAFAVTISDVRVWTTTRGELLLEINIG
jgi:hypothetical protein